MATYGFAVARSVLAAALVCGLGAAAPIKEPEPDPALDAYLTPQTMATLPDGRRLSFFCTGAGAPVAIIVPGWAQPDVSWRRLQPQMSKLTKVCIVNRAGYRFSDPGPMPRDTAAEVKDLHDGLSGAGFVGPYVLVGHSLGGFDVRLFAYDFPKETTGLVLVDPPTEKIYQRDREPDEDVALMQRCADLARKGPLQNHGKDGCVQVGMGPVWSDAMRDRVIADMSRPSWFETLWSEDTSMVGVSSDEMVAARRPLGDIPIILLQADEDCHENGPPPNTDDDKFDVERCNELLSQARDSTRGERRIVAGASHMVQEDKPEVFLAAFREVIEASRASGMATAEKP